MNDFTLSYLNSRLLNYKPNIMQITSTKYIFTHAQFLKSIEGITQEAVEAQLQQAILKKLLNDLESTIAIPSIDFLFDRLSS